jgi:hypothetical protein
MVVGNGIKDFPENEIHDYVKILYDITLLFVHLCYFYGEKDITEILFFRIQFCQQTYIVGYVISL